MLCSLPAKEDKWQVITEGVELFCKKSTGKWIWLKFNKENTRGSPAEFLVHKICHVHLWHVGGLPFWVMMGNVALI